MPELPEVEVTRLEIEPLVRFRTIVRVDTHGAGPVLLTRPAVLRHELLGHCITRVERRGKYLLFQMENGGRLVIHLGMTGQLLVGPRQGIRAQRHLRLLVSFRDGGPVLVLRDPRKFGRVFWLGSGRSCARLDRLGPDALLIDKQEFARRLRGRRTSVKTALLDQSLLAGVGNIYADEALFAARLRPTRRAAGLALSECYRLLGALRRVLRRAISRGGTTVSDFVHPDGSRGSFQFCCRVYGREAEPCVRCGTTIVRCRLGQRSTHYCPACQH